MAALSGSSLSQGEQRTRDVLTESLAGGGVAGVSASRERLAGVEIVAVTVTASLPLIGLLGPTSLQVIGHAVREDS